MGIADELGLQLVALAGDRGERRGPGEAERRRAGRGFGRGAGQVVAEASATITPGRVPGASEVRWIVPGLIFALVIVCFLIWLAASVPFLIRLPGIEFFLICLPLILLAAQTAPPVSARKSARVATTLA